MNTFYTVHVYREMRLTFPAVEATTPETAARLAAALPTYSADAIEDCDGSTYSALVDTQGDENYAKSRTVFFRADGGEIEPAPKRITNQTRAAIAEACVSVFTQHTGSDRRDALGDLCDLMHFANQRDYDLGVVLNSAIAHFEEELADEGKLLPHLIERVSTSGRFLPAASQLLEALEYLLPHAAQEVEDRKATGIAEYDDLEEAVEKARAAVSVATQPPKADERKTLDADPTPGPWLYNDSGIVSGKAEGDGEAPFICDMCPDRDVMTSWEEANAKLITSAPTLLDALLDIKRLASKHDDSGYCPYTVLELIEATAMVAIGKAR